MLSFTGGVVTSTYKTILVLSLNLALKLCCLETEDIKRSIRTIFSVAEIKNLNKCFNSVHSIVCLEPHSKAVDEAICH